MIAKRPEDPLEREHRYDFVKRFVTGARVLDLAQLPSDVAVPPLPFANDEFDVVVALEDTEHILGQQALLDEFRRVLCADGTLIVSSPIEPVYSARTEYLNEVRSLLTARFAHVTLYAQHTEQASLILAEHATPPDSLECETTGANTRRTIDASSIVAICRSIGSSDEHTGYSLRLGTLRGALAEMKSQVERAVRATRDIETEYKKLEAYAVHARTEYERVDAEYAELSKAYNAIKRDYEPLKVHRPALDRIALRALRVAAEHSAQAPDYASLAEAREALNAEVRETARVRQESERDHGRAV